MNPEAVPQAETSTEVVVPIAERRDAAFKELLVEFYKQVGSIDESIRVDSSCEVGGRAVPISCVEQYLAAQVQRKQAILEQLYEAAESHGDAFAAEQTGMALALAENNRKAYETALDLVAEHGEKAFELIESFIPNFREQLNIAQKKYNELSQQKEAA